MNDATSANDAACLSEAITALGAARAAKDPVEALRQAWEWAHATILQICDFEDYIKEDDPLHAVLSAELERRHEAQNKAIMALCAYPPKTLDEATDKAQAIIVANEGCVLEEDYVNALLQSFAA